MSEDYIAAARRVAVTYPFAARELYTLASITKGDEALMREALDHCLATHGWLTMAELYATAKMQHAGAHQPNA